VLHDQNAHVSAKQVSWSSSSNSSTLLVCVGFCSGGENERVRERVLERVLAFASPDFAFASPDFVVLFLLRALFSAVFLFLGFRAAATWLLVRRRLGASGSSFEEELLEDPLSSEEEDSSSNGGTKSSCSSCSFEFSSAGFATNRDLSRVLYPS
jgi:hypothetical protein